MRRSPDIGSSELMWKLNSVRKDPATVDISAILTFIVCPHGHSTAAVLPGIIFVFQDGSWKREKYQICRNSTPFFYKEIQKFPRYSSNHI